ncbi:ATPase, T2SS/T4P/T4SS family [Paenibacillus polymyxa]|uniref:ATPase, T2SS/T4P/T4SS family n=1 Tax=Paenibacillus polymyxa TaxID=1406 RepID=UPI0032B00210
MRNTSKTQTIAIANFGGGDSSSFVFELLKQLPKGSKSIVVEFPCLGIPRIGYATQDEKITELQKTKTMDQLILDYDRIGSIDVNDYVFTSNYVDFILTNPNALTDNPVIRKVKSNRTLINLPLFLKSELGEKYDYIFFVTQGTMIHPMTNFAIRMADAVVLYSNRDAELIGNVLNGKRIVEIFGVANERLFLFSADRHVRFKERPVYKKCSLLLKEVLQVPPLIVSLKDQARLEESPDDDKGQLEQEQVGVIDPIDYLHYEFHASDLNKEISETEEKSLSMLADAVRKKLQQNYLDEYVDSLRDAEARQKVRYVIADIVRETTDKQMNFTIPVEEVVRWVQREITELGVLQEIMSDPEISSIEINAPDQIVVEKNGIDIHLEDVKFQSAEHYFQFINKICEPMGKSLTGNDPIIDLNYNGFRVCVVADTVKRQGVSDRFPLVSIRKFPPNVYSHQQCVDYGNLSWEIIDFQKVISQFANIVYTGPTNCGKTASLLRQPLFVPKITRVLTIEDSREIMYASKVEYQSYPNLPALLVKEVPGNPDRTYGIDRLIKASLRLRPEIIVIGEIRDKFPARESLIGMNTGHRVWTSIHSNSAQDCAKRFLQLCSNDGNDEAVAAQVADSIDFIFFQRKLPGGRRVIIEVAELLEYRGAKTPVINPIFQYNYDEKKHIRVGSIKGKGMREKMKSYGVSDRDIDIWCAAEAVSQAG